MPILLPDFSTWFRSFHRPAPMAHDLAFGWEPWTAPVLEDLLPQLSREEQVRLHNYLREQQRIRKGSLPSCSEGERDFMMIRHVRYALHHYNARHPGEEFDAVKPLMVAGAVSRGQMWYHLNFWACCRKSKKIKRFFAEVHYKTAFSALTSHHRFKELRSHPAALAAALFTRTCHHQSQEKPPSSSSSSTSVCSDLPGDENPPSSRSSVCLDLPPPVPGAEKPPSNSPVCSHLSPPVPGAENPSSINSSHPVPIVETCTIMEESLGRYSKSCAFCPGHLGILHPKGRKFVCGNDKDRMVPRDPAVRQFGDPDAIHLPHGPGL